MDDTDQDDWLTALRTSLFQRLFLLLQYARTEERTIRLDKQFRMHPDLGNLVRRMFYEPTGPRIENGGTAEQRRHGFAQYGGRPAAWHTTTRHRCHTML
ncbi:hypothetical protein FRACA_200004 [Frankia canadensis]|uniref:DNA2/NAM7 helicase-like C-terminal domain-containing protein n=1 Tax=Frankia canadensis TaxID=1836972 RepID=A0A2I2KQ58_9ACTN|nr:AAA domain-containing protein [Frankia canadensis]SNQ47766.1 hypothetical protein FRACA_200004 [Frankia canadensis]SOU55056.1 hypothetical protein FRACA_200004 [Frankia canadensis]